MCNNVLPIEKEKDRWLRQDINNRKCTLCNTNEVGDECHYIFKCPFSLKIEIQYYLQDFVETQIGILYKT